MLDFIFSVKMSNPECYHFHLSSDHKLYNICSQINVSFYKIMFNFLKTLGLVATKLKTRQDKTNTLLTSDTLSVQEDNTVT